MDAKLSGPINAMQLSADGDVQVRLVVRGRVLGEHLSLPAKDVSGELLLNVKKLVANELKWGETLYVTISSTPPKEQS